jgi:hypothetical protein
VRHSAISITTLARALAAVGLLWRVVACSAQEQCREIEAVVVHEPPVIDGVLDDACWEVLPSSSGFADAEMGTEVQDDTTIWIGYDQESIYVAFHCFDSEPSRIFAQETRRGSELSGEDRVRFRLNPFNSMREEDESELTVNPLGTQNADFAGGRATKQEWEGEWLSAARIVEDGWVCEIAVPWRNFVRPPSNGEPVTLGVNFERYQARTQIRSYWSDIGRQERLEYGGRWLNVILPPVTSDKPLSFLAYSFAGTVDDEEEGRGGMDVRYKFSPLLTGVATLNPDFSNIEDEVTSIDFSYSERLADEYRPFFLEGSDYFEGPLEWVMPFRSIRIPGFDYGGKVYGRIGEGMDVGGLFTQEMGRRADAVANLVWRLSPYDSVGLMSVSRFEEGVENHVLTGGGLFRRGDWFGALGYARSFDREGPGEYLTTYLAWSPDNWHAGGGFWFSSPGYLPRDGYVKYTDERGWFFEFMHAKVWRTGPFQEFWFHVETWSYEHYDGSSFRDGYLVSIDGDHRNGLGAEVWWQSSHFEENADEVQAVELAYPVNDKFRNLSLEYGWGRRAGRSYSYLGPGVQWKFFGRLAISLTTEVLRHVENREQDIFGVSYDLSREQSIGGRLVRRDGETNWYLSFRSSGYGGTEYYIILGDPNADEFRERLVFKLIREF